jgi:hypothetical protein
MERWQGEIIAHYLHELSRNFYIAPGIQNAREYKNNTFLLYQVLKQGLIQPDGAASLV